VNLLLSSKRLPEEWRGRKECKQEKKNENHHLQKKTRWMVNTVPKILHVLFLCRWSTLKHRQ
jgi:hypothetical protein